MLYDEESMVKMQNLNNDKIHKLISRKELRWQDKQTRARQHGDVNRQFVVELKVDDFDM